MSIITKKSYIYRKHLRQPSKFLLGLFLYFALSFIYPILLLSTGDGKSINLSFYKHLLAFAIPPFIGIAVSYLVLYFILFKKLKNICVSLDDDKITYNNGKKEISIAYTDITALKFPSIKYTGGWIKIVYGKKSIRLTVVLENIGEFVKELKERLDKLDKSNIYKEKKLYSFYKTATYSDYSWERVYEYFFTYLKAFMINLVVCYFISFFVTVESSKFLISMSALIGILVAFVLSELLLAVIFAKKIKTDGFNIKARNKELELKIHKSFFSLAIIIQIIVIVFTLL